MKMLDHQKTILRNIYHNRNLFLKELQKSVQWLTPNELKELINWINQELGDNYYRDAQLILQSA